jgi:curved DNA-binding protein CbpA
MLDHMTRRANAPDLNTNDDVDDGNPRQCCAAKGCNEEGVYPAPKSRSALRDYIWFCLEHVREYNKSWNYYEGLQGAALEAEIRRATTWERPSWKFATGKPSENNFEDPLGLFDFDNRDTGPTRRQISPDERRAWQILQLSPVTDIDIVKKQYKRLVKQNHPDKNGGDAAAEERLKDINLAYSLVKESLVTSGTAVAN